MLISLAIAVVAQYLPKFAFQVLVCAAAGSYAGFVVLEYAAWAQANPNVSVERLYDFWKPVGQPKEPPVASQINLPWVPAVAGAAMLGAGYGILSMLIENLISPSAAFCEFLRSTVGKPQDVPDVLTALILLGFTGIVAGFAWTASSLRALKLANPMALQFRLSPGGIDCVNCTTGRDHELVYRSSRSVDWKRRSKNCCFFIHTKGDTRSHAAPVPEPQPMRFRAAGLRGFVMLSRVRKPQVKQTAIQVTTPNDAWTCSALLAQRIRPKQCCRSEKSAFLHVAKRQANRK